MVTVRVGSYTNPSLLPTAGALDLRLEINGVAQIYSIVPNPFRSGKEAIAFVPRAALPHLHAAVNSRSGMLVTVGDGTPIRFSVPTRAAAAFHECRRNLLRDRPDGN